MERIFSMIRKGKTFNAGVIKWLFQKDVTDPQAQASTISELSDSDDDGGIDCINGIHAVEYRLSQAVSAEMFDKCQNNVCDEPGIKHPVVGGETSSRW